MFSTCVHEIICSHSFLKPDFASCLEDSVWLWILILERKKIPQSFQFQSHKEQLHLRSQGGTCYVCSPKEKLISVRHASAILVRNLVDGASFLTTGVTEHSWPNRTGMWHHCLTSDAQWAMATQGARENPQKACGGFSFPQCPLLYINTTRSIDTAKLGPQNAQLTRISLIKKTAKPLLSICACGVAWSGALLAF